MSSGTMGRADTKNNSPLSLEIQIGNEEGPAGQLVCGGTGGVTSQGWPSSSKGQGMTQSKGDSSNGYPSVRWPRGGEWVDYEWEDSAIV